MHSSMEAFKSVLHLTKNILDEVYVYACRALNEVLVNIPNLHHQTKDSRFSLTNFVTHHQNQIFKNGHQHMKKQGHCCSGLSPTLKSVVMEN